MSLIYQGLWFWTFSFCLSVIFPSLLEFVHSMYQLGFSSRRFLALPLFRVPGIRGFLICLQIWKRTLGEISSSLLANNFTSRATPHNLRSSVSFKLQKVCSIYNGTETLFILFRTKNLYYLEILNQISKNGLFVTVRSDYAKNLYIN